MKHQDRICLFAILGLVAFSVFQTSTVADDWPRWMGPKYDGVLRETGLIDKFSDDGPNVVWRQPIGAGYAGASIVGDQIFVMDRTEDGGDGGKTENNIAKKGEIAGGERVLCLDSKSGKELWSHQYDCPYRIAYPTGPRCTPTVDGEHVYTLGAMGHLKCFTRANGKIVWEKLLTEAYDAKPPFWGYASHPYVDGENLIVPVGGKGSGLVAFDKKTGKEIWKSVTTNDIAYAPVVIYEPKDTKGERQLIFWHGKGITSVNPTNGEEFWFVKFPEEANASIVTIATPLIHGNKLLIAEFYKGALLLEMASNPPSVKEVWRNFKKNPKLDDAMNCMMSTPFVENGLVYGVAYSRQGGGVLRCVDLETGEMKWNDPSWMGGEKPLMFANAFITPNEDKQFVFNDIGEMMIGKFTAKGFEELDRAKLVEPTSVARGRDVVWSHPAYANGHVVVRNDKEIVCVNLKKD
jgi:outer membrane protein assembly factor BamB